MVGYVESVRNLDGVGVIGQCLRGLDWIVTSRILSIICPREWRVNWRVADPLTRLCYFVTSWKLLASLSFQDLPACLVVSRYGQSKVSGVSGSDITL